MAEKDGELQTDYRYLTYGTTRLIVVVIVVLASCLSLAIALHTILPVDGGNFYKQCACHSPAFNWFLSVCPLSAVLYPFTVRVDYCTQDRAPSNESIASKKISFHRHLSLLLCCLVTLHTSKFLSLSILSNTLLYRLNNDIF
jgi:hypothetical protein